MAYQLNPHISVDCVIFGFDSQNLRVLLIEREIEENNGIQKDLKLPGNLVRDDEDMDTAAHRVLKELTGLNNIYLEQFKVFSDPDRIKNPKDINWLTSISNLAIQRVVTIAYYSLVKIDESQNKPNGSDYQNRWFRLCDIPKLPFDHNIIVNNAVTALRNTLKTRPIGFELLPKKFTIRQLQNLYEAILGINLDSRNFRKKINKLEYIIPLNEKEKNVAHKPAQLFSFDRKKYLKNRKDSFGFNM